MAFQSCIYATMKMYYDHRGYQGCSDVVYCHKESKRNSKCLKHLQQQFRTVIELISRFLDNK